MSLYRHRIFNQTRLFWQAARDLIAHVCVPAPAALVHSRQHEHVRIDVVINLNHALVVVQPVKTPDVLLQRPLPGERNVLPSLFVDSLPILDVGGVVSLPVTLGNGRVAVAAVRILPAHRIDVFTAAEQRTEEFDLLLGC
ncbi:MAG: hypothetical protein KJZ78_26165 [Bryobacteraceae bacterium]|nr:hypothetical protein [Bryobacteraceae bacterium]